MKRWRISLVACLITIQVYSNRRRSKWYMSMQCLHTPEGRIRSLFCFFKNNESNCKWICWEKPVVTASLSLSNSLIFHSSRLQVLEWAKNRSPEQADTMKFEWTLETEREGTNDAPVGDEVSGCGFIYPSTAIHEENCCEWGTDYLIFKHFPNGRTILHSKKITSIEASNERSLSLQYLVSLLWTENIELIRRFWWFSTTQGNDWSEKCIDWDKSLIYLPL